MIDKSLNWMKNSPENLAEGGGYYSGISKPNELVIIDTWQKSDEHIENMNVLGVTGTGMSVTTKLKILRERGIYYAKEK